MIKQTLMFTTPVRLSLRDRQLVIAMPAIDEKITRPIEDIGVVVVENQQVQVTVPLLNALTQNNVAVVICDDKGMPASMLQPLEANTTQQETYRIQIGASQPTRKRIWKELIESKIRNQAAVLDKTGHNGDILRPLYCNVLSGDSTNREGIAARIYWKELFGTSFVRVRDGEMPNALLNYGYAILRAAVTRAIVGSGMLPAFGLFHRNRYNAFPLSDDVMEPYRPFVDDIVYNLYCNNPNITLNRDAKMDLLRVLTCDVVINKHTHPLEIALSLTTASIAKTLKDNKQTIVCPELR